MAYDGCYSSLTTVFRVVCWIVTMVLISYWIFIYTLNQDVCLIDYKMYYEKPSDVYPVLSICLKESVTTAQFQKQNQDLTNKRYLKFLEGKYFSSRFTELDYNDIRLNLSDYVDNYYFEFRNGSGERYNYAEQPMEIFLPSFAGFRKKTLYNCYDLQTPHDNQISQFAVRIRSGEFPSDFRSTNYTFFGLLHYPNQLLISYKTLRHGISRQEAENGYAMRFYIRGVEILQRRNKHSRLCNENWQNYDNIVLQHHLDNVGCRAPYQGNQSNKVPLCSNIEQMTNAMMIFRSDGYGVQPPCRSMEKIEYTYSEADLSDTKYVERGSFWLIFYILNPQFKEIVQAR